MHSLTFLCAFIGSLGRIEPTAAVQLRTTHRSI